MNARNRRRIGGVALLALAILAAIVASAVATAPAAFVPADRPPAWTGELTAAIALASLVLFATVSLFLTPQHRKGGTP